MLAKEDHVVPEAEQWLLACGRVSLDCQVRLVDDKGAAVPNSAPGEILIRAPFAMTACHNAAALTAETITADGWICTRDIGQFDADGFLYLVDRTSDMIVTGGYNVYPREVEDVLVSHPAVREVVVVGLPDDRWEEAVTVFVVPRSGHDADPDTLIAFACASLARYKVPKDVCYIDDLAKSAASKLLSRAVRDPFWRGLERKR